MIKKIVFNFLVFVFLGASAQISLPEYPISLGDNTKKAKIIPVYNVKDYNHDILLEEDKEFPVPERYGVVESVNIDVKKQGNFTQLGNGKLWQYKLKSNDGLSIGVHFTIFNIPKGARLWVFDQDYKKILGAFTSQNNTVNNYLAIADLPGEHAIIEYFEPNEVEFPGKLTIGKVIYGYRDLQAEMALAGELIDINCPQGESYQLIKHAVCRITFTIENFSYNCSGALINNTLEDGKPYFLTAFHCVSTNVSANTVVAYFNYETDDCNGLQILHKTLSGTQLIASFPDSDFSLLLLNSIPPIDYQPVYAGWNANNVPASSTFSIHHPEGGLKKLSIDYQSSVSYNRKIIWDDEFETPPNSHWQIGFDLGLTLGGSSGGPLFNANFQIVGQLHGGDENNVFDYYGKLSYSWDGSNLANNNKLKPWLDPINSGVKVLSFYIPDQKPTSSFYVDNSQPCVNAPVYFTDNSYFNPTEWVWSITPNSFTYEEGTDSSSQNPVISFQELIPYTIELQVKNNLGVSSRVKRDYIFPTTKLDLAINNLDTIICAYELVNYPVFLSGATNYEFLVDTNYKDIFSVEEQGKDSFYLDLNYLKYDSTDVLELTVIGNHSICIDTLIQELKIVKPKNDDVENATTVSIGQYYSSFDNKCAINQENEVSPPITGCNGQYEWCDEYRDGSNVVEHTVWFKFIPDFSGTVGIETKGFDNQIALYQSDNSEELLKGSLGNYTLIAANDDYHTDDFSAAIIGAEVEANKMYWIQVDGSGGGTIGDFSMLLVPHKIISEILSSVKEHTIILPNPSNDIFYIAVDTTLLFNAKLEVYNNVGVKVFSSQINEDDWRTSIPIDLHNEKKGIYFLKCTFDNKEVVTHKLILY